MSVLERGIALTEKPDADPEYGAEVRFELAKALLRVDPHSGRARSLAQEALASYTKVGSKRAGEVGAFVAQSPVMRDDSDLLDPRRTHRSRSEDVSVRRGSAERHVHARSTHTATASIPAARVSSDAMHTSGPSRPPPPR